MHCDGAGLYLQVTSQGGRSWIFRYMHQGTAREMGLGPLRDVPLAKARQLAESCRQQKLTGVDPLLARRQGREASAMTFRVCAEKYIETHTHAWKNEKHAKQWESTFKTYVWDQLGDRPVDKVVTDDILNILEPIWNKKTETATRLRGRLESVLDWATARGYRDGANPARWKGHLSNLLPLPSKVRRVQHHPALPYKDIAAFIRQLRTHGGMAADALEFVILTATRTSETIGARWDEINLDEGVWIIPPERIKSGREHRVPLSRPAVEILRRLSPPEGDEKPVYVFRPAKGDKPISNMTMLKLLARMGRDDITVHGFRSCFRDWTSECTSFSREVAEMSLAHAIGDKVEAAYRRGDLFKKRQQLMAAWANYCLKKPVQNSQTNEAA